MGTRQQISSNQRPKLNAALNEHYAYHTVLPKGLVGSKITANVKLEGVDCICFIGTGLQITTISQSFYDQYLSEHPV